MDHSTHDDFMGSTILTGRQPHPADGTRTLYFPTGTLKFVRVVVNLQFVAAASFNGGGSDSRREAGHILLNGGVMMGLTSIKHVLSSELKSKIG